MEFVKAIGPQAPVYAIDDDVMMSGKEFSFSSIEDVAKHCVPLVQQIMEELKAQSLTLGGWSYGGVVATAVAKLASLGRESWKLDAIVLFDSPLREPKKLHDAPITQKDSLIQVSAEDNDPKEDHYGVFDLNARTSAHFASCTGLLRLHHQRERELQPLHCPVLDVRPLETDYDCGLDAVQELTSSSVARVQVSGSHWTMMFGDNVAQVAAAVSSMRRV